MKAQIVPFEEWLALHPELEGGEWVLCTKCEGDGQVFGIYEEDFEQFKRCSKCNGEGWIFEPCFEIGEKKRLYEDDVKKELERLQRWRG